MKLFSLLPNRLIHLACNSPPAPLAGAGFFHTVETFFPQPSHRNRMWMKKRLV